MLDPLWKNFLDPCMTRQLQVLFVVVVVVFLIPHFIAAYGLFVHFFSSAFLIGT